MTKHNHQNTARRFDSKVQGAAPFHQDKMPLEASELMESKEIAINNYMDSKSKKKRE